ncbi:MAG: Co2+/Mg2+ efflux protein ApaG [Balneolaceae bacterium]|nr:Co2+/Mg2+ efflux protein ApaG [Balneolaceae bacterium]
MYRKSYIEISNNIEVEVRPAYLEDRSEILRRKHLFVYFITIRNRGAVQVQLLNRHWEIEDSAGETYEVDGDGVIGKKPYIGPGEKFEYNSSCMLKSHRGKMKGYYIMKNENREKIKVVIPEFTLTSHRLN